MRVKVASVPPEGIEDLEGEDWRKQEKARMRIGGYDNRKQVFKGWVDVEYFRKRGFEGSFVVFQRDEGNPISWRTMWKEVVKSELVLPYVLRKGSREGGR